MTMQLQIISINALILSLLIDVRRSSNQKSFNVKFHSVRSYHSIVTTVRTSNLSDNHNSQSKSLINSFDLEDLDGSVLLQSKKCSAYEIQEKLQCFEDLPQDLYEVLHNSSVVIKCVVHNQHGKVQWRAQNVVLGYDRSVPGMDRLSIVGDASKGEHNLQISNIQPEDNGEYECQVQPVSRHPLLRKKAQVVVQVLPTSPVILYRQKKLTDHTLIITPSTNSNHRYDPKLILECQTSGTTSHVQFIWYWNRQVVSEASQPEVVITSLSNNSSQIELRVDQLKSNDKIQCRVENKASRMVRKRMKTYAELSVTITTLFYSFPGHPKILNSTFLVTRKFEEKDRLNIICQISPIGAPVPDIKLFWHFHKVALLQFENLNAQYPTGNSLEIKSHRITTDLYNDELSAHFYELRLSKWHHAANATCVVKQLLLKSNYFISVRIQVKHPPTMLKIYLSNQVKVVQQQSWEEFITVFDGIPSNLSVNLIDGNFYRFVCSTNLHYTTLNINWSLAVKENLREQYNLENSRQSELVVGEFFKQTNSYVELKASKEIVNMNLLCTAWPVDSVILSASLQIKIYYSPEKPILTGYVYPESVIEYESISLLCTTKGGFPLPDLIWYKENATLSNAEPVVSNEDKISSLLSFKVSREDNGKLINCAARNIATSKSGISSNALAINAIFPPRHVNIKTVPSQLKQIVENTTIFLVCETDSSNPASDIQWWLIRCSFNDNQRISKRQVPCSKTKLKEIHRDVASSSFNGWKTISKLQYVVKWLDNENFIECESKLPNSEKTTSLPHYDRLRLNVIFAPHFSSKLINGSVFQAQENFKLTLSLKAFGNPKLIRYTWRRGSQLLESNSSVRLLNGVMTIENITRDQRGDYSVTAENNMGKTELNFYVDVAFPPRIAGEPFTSVGIKSNEDISVFCNVTSNPYSPSFLNWTIFHPVDILSPLNETEEWSVISSQRCQEVAISRPSNETSRPSPSMNCTTPKQYALLSNYHLINSSQFHNAILQCFYDNKIPSAAARNFIFYIDSPPRYQVVKQFAIQGVKNSEPSTFTCFFKGYPIKSVEWHNCTSTDHNYMGPINSRLTNNSLQNITLLFQSDSIDEIRPNLYRADKTISQNDWRMLNRICCQAVNEFGFDFGTISVVAKMKADPPENVRILEISSNSLIIKWDQSFDGGLDQIFRIKISRKDKPDQILQFDINGNRFRNSLYHNISGLHQNTCYFVRVGSFNNLFEEATFVDPVEGCTLSDSVTPFIPGVEAKIKSNLTNNISHIPKIYIETMQKSTSFIVTVAGCVFGFIIFIINVLTFVICYKKKRERIRKRRQSKENQSTDERQTENLSKYDSSMLENHLYDGSILAASDSCCVPERRDEEEEIPMLMYQKPICPLHFVSSDQFSNPLIIQDHYLQSAISCSSVQSRKESNCYGCSSLELPLNSMILSNQYLQFPLLESTYGSLLRSPCQYSPTASLSQPQCSKIRTLGSEDSQINSRLFLGDSLSKIPTNIQTIHLPPIVTPLTQTEDSYQTIFHKPSQSDEKPSIQSPIFYRGFLKNPGNN